MKGSQEIKRWKRRLVQAYGKGNGVVRSCYFDSPEMESKQGTDKHVQRGKDVSWKSEVSY